MSEQEANSVRHDNFGTEPAAELLTFVVEWKNSGDAAKENDSCDEHDTSIIRVNKRAESDWNSFKRALSTRCGRSIGDRVIYVDSEGDEIPIESQCEFGEALRFASIRSTKSQSVNLIVDRSSKTTLTGPKRDIETSRNTEKVSCQDKDTMRPMKLGDGVQDYRRIQHSQTEIKCNNEQPKRSDDTPPKWFTSYMQTMKDDIVDEVSKRVAKTVIEALQKKRGSQYDSATSRRRVSDSEYLLDSDVENNRSGPYSPRSQDRETSSMDLHCEKRNSEGAASLLADERFDDNSRGRRKNVKQQRKEHTTESASQQTLKTLDAAFSLPQSYYNYNSSLLNRRRDEKISKKQNDDKVNRVSMSPQSSRVNSKGSIDFTKVLDPHDHCINEEMTKTLHGTTAPILKLRLVDSCNDIEQNNETKVHEDKNILGSRMGCSVTGNDVLERPNDRVPENYALSDSDNISIISNVSHDSDLQGMSNSFEMAMPGSMNLRDYFVDHENREFLIATESEHEDREECGTNENRDRYSSSFELLSEPPSPPPMSIHMDEDHFSTTCDNETNDYNINDDTTMNKPCNQSKIESCPMTDDAQQVKLYKRNIVDAIDDNGDEPLIDNCPEIILTKRTDGAYSFVSETLPGSSMTKTATTNSNDESSTLTENTSEADSKMNFPKDHDNSNDSFHESTQSFHSHTAPQMNGERRDFTGYPSTSGHDEIPNVQRSNIFVDGNASKGLGDTKQSSPRKKSSASNARNTSNENFGLRRPKMGRRTSRTFAPREGNYDSRRQAEHDRIIDELVSGITVDISSANLVNGAAYVATSAYSTARRFYDVILNAQTRKTADK